MDEHTPTGDDITDGPDHEELAAKRLHNALTVLGLLVVALLLYV